MGLVKTASIQTKLEIASGALTAIVEKLDEVTKQADIKCNEIDNKVKYLEQEIERLHKEKQETLALQSLAYNRMIAVNKLLGE